MVNTEDFIKRLEFILEYYSLSASGLADKIGVQRSSLSHLLSGRNKPSLDFILKILEVFPEVDLYWILNGKGSFPKTASQDLSKIEVVKNEVAPTPISENKFTESIYNKTEIDLNENATDSKNSIKQENNLTLAKQNQIERIVIFYTNGKFIEYNPK